MKEHDVIRITTDDYEYITTSVEEGHDKFAVIVRTPLPKGTRGTIVHLPPETSKGGCYVEFPYIREHSPDAECVVWVTFSEMELT